MFLTGVSAKTYYTDYGEFSDYTDKNYPEDQLIYKEESIRYKWYINERIGLGYYVYVDDLKENQYVDYNDVIYGDFSNWTPLVPDERFGRIIEEKNVYRYANIEKIRYIHFSNFQSDYGKIFLSEIEIYNKDNKIDYTSYCEKCSENYLNHISDDEYDENIFYIENEGYLILDLGGYYYPNNLEIKLYFFDTSNNKKSYKITLTKFQDIDEELLAKEFTDYQNFKISDNVYLSIYSPNDLEIVNGKFEHYEETDKIMYPSKTLKVDIIKHYRFKDLMYKVYTYEKTYADGYHEYLENYTKDIDDYIILYRYKFRDKITVLEDIVVDNYDFNINKYINATAEYLILGEYDIYKNGKYEIKIIFKNLEIPINLYIQIPENDKNINNDKEVLDVDNKEEFTNNEDKIVYDIPNETIDEIGNKVFDDILNIENSDSNIKNENKQFDNKKLLDGNIIDSSTYNQNFPKEAKTFEKMNRIKNIDKYQEQVIDDNIISDMMYNKNSSLDISDFENVHSYKQNEIINNLDKKANNIGKMGFPFLILLILVTIFAWKWSN